MSVPLHPWDVLHDAIDGRLDATARAELQAHLDTCAECRREFDMLTRLKGHVGSAARGLDEAPADLESRLRAALDEEDRRATPTAGAALPGSGAAPRPSRRWMGWAAAAAAVLAVTIIWGSRRPADPPPVQVAADFQRFLNGALAMDATTTDVAVLQTRLNAAGLGFETRVFDFGMMNYRLTGGGRHAVGGQPSALFAYAGEGNQRLLCQMYVGQVSDLPAPDDRRTNEGIEFLVYRQGSVTVVFWQEGDVLCALAANGDVEAAIRLAFAKAVRV